MKFSIFVSLLSFNLSVSPSPHTLSFSPVTDVILEKISSPLFEIKTEHGLYVWKIFMRENVVEYTANYEAYLANTFSIDWPVKPKLIGLEYNQMNSMNIRLYTSETYILLRINEIKGCEGFYWVGQKTRLVKRQLTARLLLRMMYDINMQIPGSKFIHLSREERHKESDLFLQIFYAEKIVKRIPRLFKVTGEESQVVMEVPPLISELNGTDMFVLDHMALSINIWNPNPIKENKNKEKLGKALAKRLKKVDKSVIKPLVNVYDGQKHPNFPLFQQKFLEILHWPEGKPQFITFPMNPSSVTAKQWITKRNNYVKLFEYSFDENLVKWKEIHDRPLRMEHLEPNKAHVMIDSYTGNVFIHIGRNASYEVIEQALAAGEIIYLKSMTHLWKKVTLIYQADEHIDNLPTHFIVYFPNILTFLRDYLPHN